MTSSDIGEVNESPVRSCFYSGRIYHQRYMPKQHKFAYEICMPFVNISELTQLTDKSPFWSLKRWAPVRFRREDYFGDKTLDLATSVRKKVFKELDFSPQGAIYLLANWRIFGFIMNPIAIYYCYDEAHNLVAMLAEVTNTPWKQKHAYVIDCRNGVSRNGVSRNGVSRNGVSRNGDGRNNGGLKRNASIKDYDQLKTINATFSKAFTVSPFNHLNMSYAWSSSIPNDSLRVNIGLNDTNGKCFDGGMQLTRHEISPSKLNKFIVAYPFHTLKVLLAIYWQALRLAIKGVKFYGKDKSFT